ncbi:4-hydroxy-tetrahydrodipicolinate synthase [Paremcibacter congregatus]|uniref:4-hydroxy-tetrahydrodipicolinate synthase n=1 Tax=Paremcibacter congregatus TaxID=2043170 RepID=A0A2G4YNC7_9PROT|nr:4-hydroxy-tetrahydrodipicolinate synthase [Paremcibacter congregatus]PHZ83818.1 4-hydroxy-tetrahydrodipicolinate synthase [Paremcibacter congregatus]QDE27522.1 4-hydroxy-tetrahydrodipicolinate synthase [Paremcibacter congregatus]
MLRGSITALVTPFLNGQVDEKAFRKLVNWQIEEGIHGLVPCGTTGESPTLTHAEHNRVTEICIEEAAGRVPVVAGCGSNSTREAISLLSHAKEAGADAALIAMPYYNKPSQEGLFQHFKALNDAVDLPLVIYNIPGRSVVDMSVSTMSRCFDELKNVIGVKDATGNVARVPLQRMAMGPDFIQLSGEDQTALGFNVHGGVGCISVASNVAPKMMSEFQNLCLAGDFIAALAIQDKFTDLHHALFVEPNPGPVKYAMELLGICSADMRLPMTPITDEAKVLIEAALVKAELLD